MASSTRLPKAARRAQLIESAAAAFLARGFDGTSMDDVAQEAGVSRLIVYRNFESKQELYRTVLISVLIEVGVQFAGIDIEDVREQGAPKVMLPVARAHPDAFRLLWRHAWHEPPFEDLALEFRGYVTGYARAILENYIRDDAEVLKWASHTAGAHLIDGLCNWLDDGDPARDDEFAELMTRGLRAMAEAWMGSPLIDPSA
ncbi:MAG: TetR/AcrR family transcriptional regulator [Ilumatobacteraceae bacterium]